MTHSLKKQLFLLLDQIILQLVLQHYSLSDSLQSLLGPARSGPEDSALSVILRLSPQQAGRPSHWDQPRHHLPAAPRELHDYAGEQGSAVHIYFCLTTPSNQRRERRRGRGGFFVETGILQQRKWRECDEFPVRPHQTAPRSTWTTGFKILL